MLLLEAAAAAADDVAELTEMVTDISSGFHLHPLLYAVQRIQKGSEVHAPDGRAGLEDHIVHNMGYHSSGDPRILRC